MKLSQLASRRNLELAWRRITTGANHRYKRLYRDLHFSYERLKGRHAGRYSIRVNEQYRVTFRWEGHAYEVRVEDYH